MYVSCVSDIEDKSFQKVTTFNNGRIEEVNGTVYHLKATYSVTPHHPVLKPLVLHKVKAASMIWFTYRKWQS